MSADADAVGAAGILPVMERGLLAAAERPRSLGTVAYDAIREAITSKTLPPGRRLTEVELAEQLNVSKTPVREALLRLRQVGLIEPDGQRGVRVITASADRIRYAIEVREALEAFTARSAAEGASEAQRAAVLDAARASAKAAADGRFDDFRRWDHDFHGAIAAVVGNPRIESILDDVHALVAALLERDLPHVETGVDAHAHLTIAEAIVQGRPDAAAAAMREHLRCVKELAVTGISGDAAA